VTGEGLYKISGGKNGGYLDGAEMALLVTNLKVDWTLDLIEWGVRQGDPMKGMEPVIKCLKSISNFLGLASLGVALTQAILKCQDNVDALLKIIIPGLCAIFVIAAALWTAAMFLGPFLAVLSRMLISLAADWAGDWLINDVCGKRRRTS